MFVNNFGTKMGKDFRTFVIQTEIKRLKNNTFKSENLTL